MRSLPANALAWHDEGRCARRVGVAAVKSEGGDDHDQQGDDGDQVDLAGIVAAVMMLLVADFPAH